MAGSQPILSDVGTKLLFENDQVRVWDLCLQPGESTGLHRHEHDYLYVVLGGGVLQGRNADGSTKPAERFVDGEVRFRTIDGETIHEAVNVGEQPWRNIVVELKSSRLG